jgi:hypothetical protein
VRRHAAQEASRDAAFAPFRRAGLATSLIALAIALYAIWGAALSWNKHNSGLALIVGAVSGIITGVAANIVFERVFRRN